MSLFFMFILGLILGWIFTSMYHFDGVTPFWTGVADSMTLRIMSPYYVGGLPVKKFYDQGWNDRVLNKPLTGAATRDYKDGWRDADEEIQAGRKISKMN